MRVFLLSFMLLASTVVASNADALHDAAKTGDIAAISVALDAGAKIDNVEGGATPLYLAARRGHIAAVTLLVERGADVNAKASLGQPLMGAAAKDRIDVILFLLANGADPNTNSASRTVLHVAAENGCRDCVKALVEAGADVNAQWIDDIYLKTALHLAHYNNHSDVADYLMAHGVIVPQPAPISTKLPAADPEKGKTFFVKNCQYCHSIVRGEANYEGPNLWSVVGRSKASSKDFRGYSEPFRSLKGIWTYEDLNTFLSGPAATMPGTNMFVIGAPNEANRVDLIAYLRLQSDEPFPLPE